MITAKEYRKRNSEFEFETAAGVFLLRPVSLLTLIGGGSMPAELIRTAIQIAGLSSAATQSEILQNPAEYVKLIDTVLCMGSVSPKIVRGEGDDEKLSVGEMDDRTKIELFTAIMDRSQKLEIEGEEIDLIPFPEKPGGAAAGKNGEGVPKKTERDDRADRKVGKWKSPSEGS